MTGHRRHNRRMDQVGGETSVLIATRITTGLGIFELLANQQGLIEIVLPGCSRKTPISPESAGDYSLLLSRAAQQINEFLNCRRSMFSLELSLHGTPFQRDVWQIIQTIPYGRTMTYGEIAALLGNRGMARAVGGAAHANPLPLVIPCHRVIGASGDLTGFAGGLALKRRLLLLEKTGSLS